MHRPHRSAAAITAGSNAFASRPMVWALLGWSAVLSSLLARGQEASPPPELPGTSTTAPTVGAIQIQPVPAGAPGSAVGTRLAGTSQLAGAPVPPSGALAPAAENLFQWGRLHLYPHVDYQLTYGNDLQPVPGKQVNTVINQLSPGLLMRLGSHWTLDYTPTLRFYSDSHFQDGVDHAVALAGNTIYRDWAFGLSQGFATTSQPLIETAAQTSQETYSTGFSASRPLSSQLTLDLSLNQNFLFLDGTIPSEALTDRRSWSTLNWLDYQLSSQVSLGLGLSFSYDNMEAGSDLTTEQYQGRVTWHPGNKLTVVLTGGLSDMQFLDSGSAGLLSPIFSLAAQYRLFENTTFSVGASRAIMPSYFQNQVSESTGINAGLSQRLLGWLYLNVGGGYSVNNYHASATGTGVASVSDYNLTSFNVSLSSTFLTRAHASVFFSQNYSTSSGAAAYNYATMQSGLELSYRY